MYIFISSINVFGNVTEPSFLLHKLEQVLKHRMREVYFVLNSRTLPMHENKTDPTLVQQRHLYSKNNRKEIYMGNLEWEQDGLCIAKWSTHTLLIGQQPKYHCSLKWRQHWPWIKRAFFISNQCSRPKTSSFCCNRPFWLGVRRSLAEQTMALCIMYPVVLTWIAPSHWT